MVAPTELEASKYVKTWHPEYPEYSKDKNKTDHSTESWIEGGLRRWSHEPYEAFVTVQRDHQDSSSSLGEPSGPPQQTLARSREQTTWRMIFEFFIFYWMVEKAKFINYRFWIKWLYSFQATVIFFFEEYQRLELY
jgi:hypothetical protein